MDRLSETLRHAFRAAESHDFPPFLREVGDSNPINASPYQTTLEDLAAGRALAHRAAYARALLTFLAQLPAAGVTAEFVLIGGSVLASQAAPRDLDCVVFYRSLAAAPTTDLIAVQQAARRKKLDLRLAPCDGDPLVFARTLLFFGMLYSTNRALNLARGVVLVDCRKARGTEETRPQSPRA